MAYYGHAIGQVVNVVSALDPISLTTVGGAMNGITVDRSGFTSMVLIGQNGVAVGGATTTVFKLQHGTKSDASDMADCNVVQFAAASAVLQTGANPASTLVELDVDLEPCKQFIRVVATATTGTSVPTSCAFALGGMYSQPV